MGFAENIRRGYTSLLSPGSATKKHMSIMGALSFYYMLSIIPFVLFVAIGSLVLAANMNMNVLPFWSNFGYQFGLTTTSFLFLLLGGILYFWVFVPIGIFINALLYQLVGKFFLNIWRGTYDKTFTAAMFGVLPSMLFYWLMPIPIINIFYLAVFGVWSFVVFVIALANQQKVARMSAFLGMLATVTIVVFATMIFMILLFVTAVPPLPAGGVHPYPI